MHIFRRWTPSPFPVATDAVVLQLLLASLNVLAARSKQGSPEPVPFKPGWRNRQPVYRRLTQRGAVLPLTPRSLAPVSGGTVCCRGINQHRRRLNRRCLSILPPWKYIRIVPANVYFLFQTCLIEGVRAVNNRWSPGTLRQVEAAAAPSGNQAGPLHRDSGVILSQSLLPSLINTICQMRRPTEHLSAGRGAGEEKQRRPPPLAVFTSVTRLSVTET